MASCDDSPWEMNTAGSEIEEPGFADHPFCPTCNDGTHHRAGHASYRTRNWWDKCNGLIWKVHWALTCNDCKRIISYLPQHHRWGMKTIMHRVIKKQKQSLQKTTTTWTYLGPYPRLCVACGHHSQADGPLCDVWQEYARTPTAVLPEIESGLFDSGRIELPSSPGF